MKFKFAIRPCVLVLSAFVAAGCASIGGQHAQSAAPVVGTDNADAIKGNKRVAIERFGVEFYTQLYGQSKSVRITATQKDISDTTRQAITQQAYSDTVAALQKAGFEVVDAKELANQPLFKELDAKYGKPSPYVVEDEQLMQIGKQISHIVAPEGMKAFFQSGTARGDFQQRTDNQNYAIGKQQGELAKALGATLLDVHVLASFGTMSAAKYNAFLRLGGKVGIQTMPVLFAEDTQIQIVNSGGARTFGMSHRMGHSGAVYLKEPLVAATNIFGLDVNGERAVVTAASEEVYRNTYQALIHDAIGSMVAELGKAR